MKVLGLDIGDVWVGSSISDGVGITCRPYKTIKIDDLDQFIEDELSFGEIGTVVVGHPVTVGGGSSAQTKSVENIFKKLKDRFSQINSDNIFVSWILWDERFSSKRAASVMSVKSGKSSKSKEDKIKGHSIAAAFILQNYLDSKAF